MDGAGNTFDFTHIDDTVRGLVLLVDYKMRGGDGFPPIHFVTGQPTTLQQLAEMAIEIADTDAEIRHAPARTYDVVTFCGDPTRARELLGWSSQANPSRGTFSTAR